MEKDLKVEDWSSMKGTSWKLFCALRINCHDFQIERGRYCNPQNPVD